MRDGSGIYTVPPGTDGVHDTTISSTRYNAFVHDVETDLNFPRPIVAGGTGASNPKDARTAMQAEYAMQVVTNFDSAVWETGSFFSDVGATGSPDGVSPATNKYVGTVQVVDPNTASVQARNVTTNISYSRVKLAGVWGAWSKDSGSGAFVLKAGDEMSGDLKISKTAPVFWLNKGTTASETAAIVGERNGVLRWSMHLGNATAESGTGNTGSDFMLMSFDDAGNLISTPLLVKRASGAVTMNGQVLVNGTLCAANNPDAGMLYLGTSGAHFLYCDGSAYTLAGGHLFTSAGRVWGSNDGTPIWTTGGTTTGTLNVNSSAAPAFTVRQLSNDANMSVGFLNVAGSGWAHQFYGNGNYTCTGNVDFSGGSLTVGGTTSSTAFYSYSGANPNYAARNTNDAAMAIGVLNAAGTAWVITANGAGQFNCQQGWKPGGGTWADSSDARIKNVQRDYEHGLNEVLALRPVRYTFKGNDVPYNLPDTPDTQEVATAPYPNSPHYNAAVAGTEFIGLIAQEAEGVMPELVTQRQGYIDGALVDDLRALESGALVYALVNAVKALAARVAALEAPR